MTKWINAKLGQLKFREYGSTSLDDDITCSRAPVEETPAPDGFADEFLLPSLPIVEESNAEKPSAVDTVGLTKV